MRWSCLLLCLTLVASAACKKEASPTEKPALPSAASIKTSPDPDVKPVYPALAGEAPAAVKRFCAALHQLPKLRRAECCQRQPGIVITAECERNLAGALADGSVTLKDAEVAACEAAMTAAHQGCEWVGPWPVPMPAACLGVVHGTREAGARCRSTLECTADLRCHGAGPTDVGKCGASAPPGSVCGTAVDTLAVYTRQDDVDRRAPPCADGYCDRNRCVKRLAAGQPCASNAMCTQGLRCGNGKCIAGEMGAAGEPCLGGDCAAGLRCIDRACATPKAAGDACKTNMECSSACYIPPGNEEGTCKMTCDSAPILQQLSKPMKPAQ